MLASSHSLPNVHAASRTHELPENDNTPERKSNSPNASIFGTAMLSKINDVAHTLSQDTPF